MAAPEVDNNPVIQLAQAFARVHLDTRPDLREYRPLFDAILARTASEFAPEIKTLFADLDDRTLRRRVESLNAAIESICKACKMLSILSIEEGRPGHQTAELKRSRHTFQLHPNTGLQDFYVRKWWSPLFPNTPGVEPLGVSILYPTVDQGDRVLASQGDLQLVKHLTRSLWMNEVACDDEESSAFKDDPDEADRHLILSGNEEANHVIAQVTLPSDLTLRLRGDMIADGATRVWRDGDAGMPRSVHALVTVCKSQWTDARLWIFEARHDRALEAVGRFFADARKLAGLAAELGLKGEDKFPASLQLVFAVDVNRQNQLRGADGGIRLAHTSFQKTSDPTPRQPAMREVKRTATVLPMKKRRA